MDRSAWIDGARRAVVSAVVVVGAAAFVAALVERDPLIAIGVGGGFVLVSMFGIADARTPRALTIRTYRWIPWAWLVLFVVSNHQSNPERTPLDAAAGLASLQNVVEIGAYGAIATAIAMLWNFRAADGSARISWGPLVVLPALAGISVLWSIIPMFSLVRSVQLAVPLALALLMARIWRTDPDIGSALWRRSCVALVIGVSLLVTYGWLAEGLGALLNADRFTWPYMHPVHAGIYIGAALLVLVVGGRSFAGLPPSVHWGLVALLTGSLYLTRTRSALGAFLVAFAVALLLPPRPDAARRFVGIVWLAGAGVLAWLVAGQAILTTLARGQSSDVFTTLNSRVPLWGVAFDELSEGSRWFTGFGFGSARVVLFSRVSWAGTAHNAWVELLIGIGVIGCILVAGAILRTAFRSLAIASAASRSDTRLAASLVVFLLVLSLTTSELAIPGFDYALLMLVYTITLAIDHPRDARGARERGRETTSRASPAWSEL